MPLKRAVKEAHNHQYCKAVELFEQIDKTNHQGYTYKDKYLYAKSLNKCYNENENQQYLQLAFQLSKEVFFAEPEYRLNTSLYMWLTYKCYVSPKANDIVSELRLRAANFIIQNTVQEKYSPFEFTVTEIVKLLDKEAPRNPTMILEWQHHLNPELLSKNGNSFKRDSGEMFNDASPFEKWHVTNIKLLLETEQYEASIAAVDTLIETLKSPFGNFHHNNDIWSLRRKAQALFELQRIDEAYLLLGEIVRKFPHSSIYHDLMKISRLQNNAQQALLYGAEGLLDKAGKYEHKLKILKDCAEILASQDLIKESYAHYALIQKVRERNKWRTDSNVLTEMTRLHELNPTCKNFSNKELTKLWQEWIQQQYEIDQGIVKTILPNQKSGFIQSKEEKHDFYFNIRNSNCPINELISGTPVSFRKKPSFDRAKNRNSIEAIQITVLGKGD